MSISNPLNNYLLLLDNLNHLNSDASTDEILNKIVSVGSSLLKSEQVVILLYDYVVNGLRVLADSVCSDGVFEDKILEVDDSFFGNAFFDNNSSFVKNIDEDNRFVLEIDGKLCASPENLKSIIIAPMFSPKKNRLGIVVAMFSEVQDQNNAELFTLMKLLTQQSAILISKAKLDQEMQHTLDNIANFEQMKTAFIAITSHELRTPLGVIIGYATYLQNLVSEKNKEFVDAILSSAIRLKEIIEDTRNLKNSQNDQATIHLKLSKINHLLEDVVKANSFLAYNDNIKIQMEFPDTNVKANIDKEKFTTAIDHLIRNAVLFNNQNGIVKVILEENDDFFTVSILDNGIGIPEEDLDKIFDRFYQVSSHLTRHIGGMGLGLSISKSLIEMHNGQISVQSVVGRGSRFIVMLPKNPEKFK